MISAHALRQGLAHNGVIEHATYGYPIYMRTFYSEPNEPTCRYVHDQHHPGTAQKDRFAAEQVNAPQAGFHMADE